MVLPSARVTTATNIDLESVNFGYRVSVERGKPTWTPTQVFDDGHKTFLKFPASMLTREAPALFVLSPSNETELVNYRVRNDYYIVDRLIDRAELRLGLSLAASLMVAALVAFFAHAAALGVFALPPG